MVRRIDIRELRIDGLHHLQLQLIQIMHILRLIALLTLTQISGPAASYEQGRLNYFILSTKDLIEQQEHGRGVPKNWGPFWDFTPDDADTALRRLRVYLEPIDIPQLKNIKAKFSTYAFQLYGVIDKTKRAIYINGTCDEQFRRMSKFDSELYTVYSMSDCYFQAIYDPESHAIISFFTESLL